MYKCLLQPINRLISRKASLIIFNWHDQDRLSLSHQHFSADCSWLIWLIAWLMATPGSSRMPCASRWKLEMSDWRPGRVEVEVVSVIRSLPYWSHSADFFRSFCSPSSLPRLWCQTFLASGVFCSRVTAGLMGSVLTCALGLTIDDRLAYASPYITEDEKLLLLNDAWRGGEERREGSGQGGRATRQHFCVRCILFSWFGDL